MSFVREALVREALVQGGLLVPHELMPHEREASKACLTFVRHPRHVRFPNSSGFQFSIIFLSIFYEFVSIFYILFFGFITNFFFLLFQRHLNSVLSEPPSEPW
jgi:hypothetical protein